jgi:hypothetical protein
VPLSDTQVKKSTTNKKPSAPKKKKTKTKQKMGSQQAGVRGAVFSNREIVFYFVWEKRWACIRLK